MPQLGVARLVLIHSLWEVPVYNFEVQDQGLLVRSAPIYLLLLEEESKGAY